MVDNLADDGPGTLRRAVLQSNNDPDFDTINFAIAPEHLPTDGSIPTIVLETPILITDAVQILGPGLDVPTAEQIKIDGNHQTQLFM